MCCLEKKRLMQGGERLAGLCARVARSNQSRSVVRIPIIHRMPSMRHPLPQCTLLFEIVWEPGTWAEPRRLSSTSCG
jgi:hypothetical protein